MAQPLNINPGTGYNGYPRGSGNNNQGGGAGGSSSGPGGIQGPGQILLVGSNGGVLGLLKSVLIPAIDITSGLPGIYAFDPTQGFDDSNNPSAYFYKVEEIIQGRTPTLNQVVITYRDLGPVSIVVVVSGTTDSQSSASISAAVQLGNVLPTGILMTKVVGLNFTAQNLQVSITRGAGGGPLSIAKVMLTGRVEIQRY